MLHVIERSIWSCFPWTCNWWVKAKCIHKKINSIKDGDKWGCRFPKGIKEWDIVLSWARKKKRSRKDNVSYTEKGAIWYYIRSFSARRDRNPAQVHLLAHTTGFQNCWVKGSSDVMRNLEYLPPMRPEERAFCSTIRLPSFP